MKIEHVHVKHHTWYTRVTVGNGDDAKTFGLQMLEGGRARLHIPFGTKAKTTEDFDSRELALARCEKI